jgi:hypothetical protein
VVSTVLAQPQKKRRCLPWKAGRCFVAKRARWRPNSPQSRNIRAASQVAAHANGLRETVLLNKRRGLSETAREPIGPAFRGPRVITRARHKVGAGQQSVPASMATGRAPLRQPRLLEHRMRRLGDQARAGWKGARFHRRAMPPTNNL